ncbi:ataxia telangiectasia mutated family protein [Nematocida displodere]|uniref:Serine/threonine-protein kinase TEL1 n=1 Tax=Nematocida displodere TaxID=1805483 RepID=A0A177EKC7_9MICR|nr:ataxia telangiectasia mutated family protein [Nematocida displodere]
MKKKRDAYEQLLQWGGVSEDAEIEKSLLHATRGSGSDACFVASGVVMRIVKDIEHFLEEGAGEKVQLRRSNLSFLTKNRNCTCQIRKHDVAEMQKYIHKASRWMQKVSGLLGKGAQATAETAAQIARGACMVVRQCRALEKAAGVCVLPLVDKTLSAIVGVLDRLETAQKLEILEEGVGAAGGPENANPNISGVSGISDVSGVSGVSGTANNPNTAIASSLSKIGNSITEKQHLAILPHVLQLLEEGRGSGMHAFIVEVLQSGCTALGGDKGLFSLFDALWAKKRGKLDEVISSIAVEETSSLVLLQSLFLYLYHTGKDPSGLLRHLVSEWERLGGVSWGLGAIEAADTLGTTLVVFIGAIVHALDRTDLVGGDLKWGVLSAVALVHREYLYEEIEEALGVGTDASMFYVLAVSLVDSSVTKSFLGKIVEMSHVDVSYYSILANVDNNELIWGSLPKHPQLQLLHLVLLKDLPRLDEYITAAAGCSLSLSVVLDRNLPPAHIHLFAHPWIVSIDLGGVFCYPEVLRVLPVISIDMDVIEHLAQITDSGGRGALWGIFLEAFVSLMAGSVQVTSPHFHRELLIRAPLITRTLARIAPKQEAIVQEAIELLEGPSQISEQEENHVYQALGLVAGCTREKTLRNDIITYLKKKAKSAFLPKVDLTPPPTTLSIATATTERHISLLLENALGYTATALKQSRYFQEAAKLSAREQSVIKHLFKRHRLCFETLCRSSAVLASPDTPLHQIISQYRSVETLLPKERPRPARSIPNSLVHLSRAVTDTIWPEKPFFYDLLEQVLKEKQALTILETQAIYNVLEYAYADSRQRYGRIERELARYKALYAQRTKLSFRGYGQMHGTKQMLALAKYQKEFFTKHYNFSSTETVISDYFNGLVSIASTTMLVFILRLPMPYTKIVAEVPCAASAAFLQIFSDLDRPVPEHAYSGVSWFFSADKRKLPPGNMPPGNIPSESDEIHLYINRAADEGALGAKTNAEAPCPFPTVEDVLAASERLTQWTSALDKSESASFVLSGALIPQQSKKFVNFLIETKARERYRFLRSLKEGAVFKQGSEVEEVLYICTRNKHQVIEALGRQRTLTTNGLSLAISALEKKWLGMPSEAALSAARPAKTFVTSILSNPRAEPTHFQKNLATHLLLLKVEEGISPTRDKMETLLLVAKRLGSLARPLEPRESSFQAQILSVQVLYTVRECEKKPLEILNELVRPHIDRDHGAEKHRVLKSLASACLLIFNRHTLYPAPKQPSTSSGLEKNTVALKEEKAVKEIQETRKKEITEVEAQAHAMGVALFITLAETSAAQDYVICLIHLLFSEVKSPTALSTITLAEIPTAHFLPLKQQIISKYFALLTEPFSLLSTHLEQLIQRFVGEFPYEVIYDVFIREDKQKPSLFLPPALRQTTLSVVSAYKLILKLARDDMPLGAPFPPNVPVLTHTMHPGTRPVTISRVLSDSKPLKGINKPVLIKILGSNGCIYHEILKKNDELKQDILSTQVFHYMNATLQSSQSCAYLKEKIRTYKIVALEVFFGVMEFVKDAEPLGAVANALHKTFFPEELPTKACREEMSTHATASLDKKTAALASLFEKHSPALKHLFTGYGPFEYFKKRRTFTVSFAISAISTYVLGLGDRHTQNILIDSSTCELVNIDLNLIFDQARLLSVPEKVPFRLTRNIQQCLLTRDALSFERAMEAFFQALKAQKDHLLVFIAILKSEPLHRWRIIQKQALKQKKPLFSDYDSIIKRLEDKLNGIEDGFLLSNSAHVQCLIHQATDLTNLASIYPGWAPWT